MSQPRRAGGGLQGPAASASWLGSCRCLVSPFLAPEQRSHAFSPSARCLPEPGRLRDPKCFSTLDRMSQAPSHCPVAVRLGVVDPPGPAAPSLLQTGLRHWLGLCGKRLRAGAGHPLVLTWWRPRPGSAEPGPPASLRPDAGRPCASALPLSSSVPLSRRFPSSRPRLSPVEDGGTIASPAGFQEHEGAQRAAAEHLGDPSFFPLSQDLDDMDADLLGLRKSHLASSKSAAKGSGRQEPPSNPKPAGTFTANEKGEWDLALWNLGGFGDAEM